MRSVQKKEKSKAIAFFDFDGTITKRDSLEGFIQFAIGKPEYYFGLLRLAPMLFSYARKKIPNDQAKEQLIAFFFKGWTEVRFQNIASRYALTQIDRITRPKAMEKIRIFQQEAVKIVIVTASIENWIKPWCDKNNIDILGTRLEFREDLVTGRFASKNCYGPEKVRRIHENYNLKAFSTIYAYGDSRGDREMLEIATQKYYRHFE